MSLLSLLCEPIFRAHRALCGNLGGLRCELAKISHPDQVVGRSSEGELPSDLKQSAMFQLAHPRDIFQPAKTFFDAFPLSLADLISAMPCSAPIDRAATASSRVLRYVRDHIHMPTLGDELG